ncbi:polymeric immunoglobulin receptor isoform X1 [Acanthochromis polyacanthus]|uniref:polymeric immunoglobulin receptor isoform X1 n=1 Tax=Acanthochromis polyacanthus TaxID=80966 RepID=UPI000B903BEC|nr:polymeric immunoglobulin receptor isoform X1 [Acanthochromis polyacanthus]
MLQLYILTLGLLPWIPASLCVVKTEEEFAVLEGQSLTIPCHYEPQYASHVKYWCQGRTKEFCTTLARTDDTSSDKVSIFDDPTQQVFTVTMKNLKEGDSGWYICGVEIGNMWKADDITFTNIKVIHGMSVPHSRVSGEEGSSVTVECLYSERYRESEKKWCRSGDWSSCLTGSGGSNEDTSVAISDDRTGAFTITLKKLQMRDTGWYLCSAGQQQIAVHVQVTPRTTTAAVSITSPPAPQQSVLYLPPPKAIAKESWSSHGRMLEPILVCSSLMLLVGLVILGRKLWKLHKVDPVLRQVKDIKARFNEYPGDVGDLQSTTVVFINKDSQDVY